MQAHEIRGRVIAKAGTVEQAAAVLKVNYTALSQVINYIRPTTHIRLKLIQAYGIRFNDKLLNPRMRRRSRPGA